MLARVGIGRTSVLPLAGVLVAVAASSAYAEENEGRFNDHVEDTTSDGGRSDRSLEATAGITFSVSTGDGGATTGSLSSADSSWTPPPCYYAPTFTPSEFKEYWEEYAYGTGHHSGKGEAIQMHEERYGEDSEYNDHHIDREGEGMWWTSVINSESDDTEGKFACQEPTFWVEFGDAPPELPGVPTPELLAELAYERVEVPETDMELNPEAAQTVNLPTWVWLDSVNVVPVEVTASVEGWDIWATTRAEPVSLTLDPGTEQADLYPASGTCTLVDGSIGEPYTAGRSDEDPPCGVVYRQATHAVDSFPLSASLTWQVAWEGSSGSGGALPDGVFATTRDVTVEEVQSIVR